MIFYLIYFFAYDSLIDLVCLHMNHCLIHYFACDSLFDLPLGLWITICFTVLLMIYYLIHYLCFLLFAQKSKKRKEQVLF